MNETFTERYTNVEQIGERLMDIFGCFSSSPSRIDASGIQSFLQRLAVSPPNERPDLLTSLREASVSLSPEDNE